MLRTLLFVSFQRSYDRFTEETVNKASTLIEIFDNQDKCQLREELMFGFDLQLVHTFPMCVLIICFFAIINSKVAL